MFSVFNPSGIDDIENDTYRVGRFILSFKRIIGSQSESQTPNSSLVDVVTDDKQNR